MPFAPPGRSALFNNRPLILANICARRVLAIFRQTVFLFAKTLATFVLNKWRYCQTTKVHKNGFKNRQAKRHRER